MRLDIPPFFVGWQTSPAGLLTTSKSASSKMISKSFSRRGEACQRVAARRRKLFVSADCKSRLDFGAHRWFAVAIMGLRKGSRFKKNLSPHQKQIRFFTRLCLVIIILATTLIFWLVNR
jgi:hypothetical protein